MANRTVFSKYFKNYLGPFQKKRGPDDSERKPENTGDKPKTKDYLPLCISIAAFLLSTFNFYFQYFREHHSLRVSASATLDDWASKKTVLLVKGVAINYGNQTEVLYSGQLTIGTPGNFQLLSKIGPIVLKPGEATSFEMKDSIGFAVDYVGEVKANGDSVFLNANIKFVSLSPGGDDCKKNYNLGTFCYYSPSDNFTFKKDSTRDKSWEELLISEPESHKNETIKVHPAKGPVGMLIIKKNHALAVQN